MSSTAQPVSSRYAATSRSASMADSMSMEAVGSSRISSPQGRISTLARAIRAVSPPERPSARRPARGVSPRASISASARSGFGPERRIFRRTVSRKAKLFWGMYPTRTGDSRTWTFPSGRTAPETSRAKVDLPLPLAPTTAQMLPGSRDRPGKRSTVRPP